MFRVGTNIIGVGCNGALAVSRVVDSGVAGARYIGVSAGDNAGFDVCCEGRNGFVEICHTLFPAQNRLAFVVADGGDRVDAALACEICAVAKAMDAMTVAVMYMPSSRTEAYTEAEEYLEELHEVADGVVVINCGYAPDFGVEISMLFTMLSNAMDSAGAKRICTNDDLADVFATERNIYFASVASHIDMDSHEYLAESLSMRLDSQMHIDIASNFTYFISCGGLMPKELFSRYVNAVNKKNIAYMPSKRAYVYENNPDYADGSFLFGVLCSQ